MADDEVNGHLVGYGKPPAKHRFQKGKSGNPNGRPRRPKPAPVNMEFGYRPADEFLRREAYRPVTIREGETLVTLPAIQAVFRAMGVAALKGNRFVQKQLTQMIADLEREDYTMKSEMFEKSIDYKQQWEREIDRCRRLGLPEPEPLPHPDDVILDMRKFSVNFAGPCTKEEKTKLDEALARRAEAQKEVNFYADHYRRSRNTNRKDIYLIEWHFEQRMFDILNDIVPPRYKAKLENRSYAEGASREGEALEELRRNRELREQSF